MSIKLFATDNNILPEPSIVQTRTSSYAHYFINVWVVCCLMDGGGNVFIILRDRYYGCWSRCCRLIASLVCANGCFTELTQDVDTAHLPGDKCGKCHVTYTQDSWSAKPFQRPPRQKRCYNFSVFSFRATLLFYKANICRTSRLLVQPTPKWTFHVKGKPS